MQTFIIICVILLVLYWYVRGIGLAILSKQRMFDIVFSNAYDKLSSPFEEIRKVAPCPSLNMSKIFIQIVFWPFYRKTNSFYLKASKEEVLSGVPTRYY